MIWPCKSTAKQNEMNFMVTAKKKTLQIISVLVAHESGEATQWSWFPFQSVITPPAPSITGISERKSYGCEKEKLQCWLDESIIAIFSA